MEIVLVLVVVVICGFAYYRYKRDHSEPQTTAAIQVLEVKLEEQKKETKKAEVSYEEAKSNFLDRFKPKPK